MILFIALSISFFFASNAANAQNIAAASGKDGEVAYFLNDGKYMGHRTDAYESEDDRPQRIENRTWPGVKEHADKIVAGMNLKKGRIFFFLRDGTYIEYNSRKRERLKPIPVDKKFRGLGPYAENISAAFWWNSRTAFFFLDDGRYIKYNINKERVEKPKTITNQNWPGLQKYANKIQSVVNWENNKAYFFLNDGQYLRYDKYQDQVDQGYPQKMNDRTWPGLGDWYARGLKRKETSTQSLQLSGQSCRELRKRRWESPKIERAFQRCIKKRDIQKKLAWKIQEIAIDYYGMTEDDFSRNRTMRKKDKWSENDWSNSNDRYEQWSEKSRNGKTERIERHRGKPLCRTIGRLPVDALFEIIELDLNQKERSLIEKTCTIMPW